MTKIICICLLLIIIILIGAGSTARRELSWENGYLVLNDERQIDPFRQEHINILKFHLNNLADTNANIIVRLTNNPTTRSFAAELPMNLQFQAYGDTQYIAYLDDKLKNDTTTAMEGLAPHRGDFCYYKPWGNIVFFNQDEQFIHGLVKLGEIQEGIQYLDQLDKATNISIDFTD